MNIVRFWVAAFCSTYIALITVMLFIVLISLFSPHITPIEAFRVAHHAYLDNDKIVAFFLAFLVIELAEKGLSNFSKFHVLVEKVMPSKYRLGSFLFGIVSGLSMILTVMFQYYYD